MTPDHTSDHTPDHAPGTTTQTLSARPALGPLFVKAALAGRRHGSTLPSVALRLAGETVGRGELTAYQRLSGYAVNDLLPHTYPHVLGFSLQAQLMSRPDFPMPMVGLVHLENAITVHRPLTVDDALDLTVYAERLTGHPKGRTVDLVTEVDVAGERVWQGRSTYLARGAGDAEAAPRDRGPALPGGFPVAQWSLAGDLGRRYAGVSGDVNPIHLSSLSAKAMGFPRAIAHGMWSYARVVAALGHPAAGAGTSRVWFRKPIILPGSVELVTDLSSEQGSEPVTRQLIAGLRSRRRPEVEHLALTFTPG